jgi:glycosyltransferase involved in cell wall biosynthesis
VEIISVFAESFGMSLVEAMCRGVPVIGTDCPLGPAEIIDHGVDGLLVPVGDGQAVTAAMLGLLADDATRRSRAWERDQNRRRDRLGRAFRR